MTLDQARALCERIDREMEERAKIERAEEMAAIVRLLDALEGRPAPPREPWQEVVCEFTSTGICAGNCAAACICIRKIGLPTFDTLEERLDDRDVWP